MVSAPYERKNEKKWPSGPLKPISRTILPTNGRFSRAWSHILVCKPWLAHKPFLFGLPILLVPRSWCNFCFFLSSFLRTRPNRNLRGIYQYIQPYSCYYTSNSYSYPLNPFFKLNCNVVYCNFHHSFQSLSRKVHKYIYRGAQAMLLSWLASPTKL